MVVDYEPCQRDWAGYQVHTKQGSDPVDKNEKSPFRVRLGEVLVIVFIKIGSQIEMIWFSGYDETFPVEGAFKKGGHAVEHNIHRQI